MWRKRTGRVMQMTLQREGRSEWAAVTIDARDGTFTGVVPVADAPRLGERARLDVYVHEPVALRAPRARATMTVRRTTGT